MELDAVVGVAGGETASRQDAVAALFREHAVSLVRLARLFVDDRNAAEDLVQEAFIRLDRSLHRIAQPRVSMSTVPAPLGAEADTASDAPVGQNTAVARPWRSTRSSQCHRPRG